MTMTVRQIKRLKNGRFGLYTDCGYLLSLDEETLLRSGLKEGDEIDAEEFEKIRARANEIKAREKALTLLAYRDHSRQELKRKLLRIADDTTAEATADQMEKLGLVNDAAFARKFAEELILRRNYGNLRVLAELRRRGIERETALEAIEAVGDAPQQRARRYLERKFPRGIPDEKTCRRAASALARDGFAWDEIRSALNQYGMENIDAD